MTSVFLGLQSQFVKRDKPRYVKRSRARKRLEKWLIRTVARLGGRYSPFSLRQPLEVQRVSVPVPDLPPPFEGFRIVQLTDIHHGPYTRVEDLNRLVDLANREEPDLAVLTGDFVLNSRRYIRECVGILGRLEAKEGIYAVLGNHDHREGPQETVACLTEQGIEVLDNRNVSLEREGRVLCLAGVADLEEDKPDLERTFAGVPEERARILLSHNPDIAEFLDSRRADLIIAGHTHGGQFIFPLIGAPVMPNVYRKYREGLRGDAPAQVFVSRGIGVTLLPIRIACPPQMSVLRLVRQGQADRTEQ